jgi:hypothetical protein
MPLTLFNRRRSPPDSRAVPIVLGVTGHRDVREADVPLLRQAVAAILETFARRYHHTPLVVLSSLAQGADQLCAEVALQQGLQVVAPLPFPPTIYWQSSSFDNDSARCRFDTLLHHPQVTAFVAPLPEAEIPSDEAGWARLVEMSDERHRCYANAGGYVVLHCHALLALWDGDESDKSAGTAQMVQFKRSGRPPESYPWTQPLLHWADSGPVYVVHTPRARIPAVPGAVAGRLDICYPLRPHSEGASSAQLTPTATQQQQEQQQFAAMCRSIDRFNRRLHASTPPTAQSQVTTLLGEAISPLPESFNRLALLREAAAALSRRFSPRVNRLTVVVFVAILLAALCFHLYAHDFQVVVVDEGYTLHVPPYLWAFIVLLLGAYALVKGVQFRRLEYQALDYRALAEALRVQLYWVAAGIGASVTSSYPQQARSEMSWIRQAVQAYSLGLHECRTAFTRLALERQIAWLRTISHHWLAGQRDYYHRHHIANHRAYHRCHYGGLALAMLGWLLALGLIAGDILAVPDSHAIAGSHGWSARHPQHGLLVPSGTLVVAGGLLIAYGERRTFEELARQYNHMYVLFAHSIEALQTALEGGDVAAAQHVLIATGCEALTEHANWLMLRRARKFELPVH